MPGGYGDPGYHQHDVNPAPAYAPPPPPPPAPYRPPAYSAPTPRYAAAPSLAPPVNTAPFAAPGGVKPSTSVADTPYAWMLSIPDVAGVLNQWQSGGLSDDWLKAHIMATPWYQHTSESARNWTQLIAQDPSTAVQKAASATADVRAMAMSMGVHLEDWTAQDLGDNVNRFGLNQNQVRDAIMAHWQFHREGMGGQAGQVEQQLQALAAQYLVPLSDYHLGGWTGAIVRGAATVEGYAGELQKMAKSLFPALSAQLDQGLTVRQLVDPYVQVASKELGVAPAQVNLEEPKWAKPLNQIDPKTGQRVMMSLSDWQSELRKNPIYGWDQTQTARDTAADLSGKLLQQFGMV